MENFKSAITKTLTSTGITLEKHKSCMLVPGTSNTGFTLDFRASDGSLNTGHIKAAANSPIYIPTRAYGVTGTTSTFIILFN